MAAAARLYFDKRPADLTLAEAAMLAGLIKAPSAVNPLRSPRGGAARAATVLDAMVDNGVIDAKPPTPPRRSPATREARRRRLAPGRLMVRRLGRTAARGCTGARSAGSLRVRTTLRAGPAAAGAGCVEPGPRPRRPPPRRRRRARWSPCGRTAPWWRWWADATTARASSIARSTRSGSPARRSSCSSTWPRCARATRRSDTIDASPVDVKGWEPENYGNAQLWADHARRSVRAIGQHGGGAARHDRSD